MSVETTNTKRHLLLTLSALLLIQCQIAASRTIPVRPSTGLATLVPGQPLHFQCEQVGNKRAEFFWYRRGVNRVMEFLLVPENNEAIEIHNDKLTLHKPTSAQAGDYICRALLDDDKSSTNPEEWAVIKARMQPYIEDFGLDSSHTGKSSIVTDGERLELVCSVRDQVTPVNITWLRSQTPDDERNMVPIAETIGTPTSQDPAVIANDPFAQTFVASDSNILVQTISKHSKRLVIESVRAEHRSYYACVADNGVTERTQRMIFIRVKDKLVALWPFLGIMAELFILFTIIYVWETQRAYKEMQTFNKAQSEEGRNLRLG